MEEFLRDQTSGELTGWLAYLQVDDEVQVQRTEIALLKVMRIGAIQPVTQDEPVIDTTDPEFVKQFQGFVGAPKR